MIVGKKIIFNFKSGVDDALVAIADEIKNGYTVTSIYKEDPGISCCSDISQKELWVVDLAKKDECWSIG